MLSLTNVLKLSIVIHYENSHKNTTFDEAFEETKAIHLMYYEAKPGRPAHYDLMHQISTTLRADRTSTRRLDSNEGQHGTLRTVLILSVVHKCKTPKIDNRYTYSCYYSDIKEIHSRLGLKC